VEAFVGEAEAFEVVLVLDLDQDLKKMEVKNSKVAMAMDLQDVEEEAGDAGVDVEDEALQEANPNRFHKETKLNHPQNSIITAQNTQHPSINSPIVAY